ncbi:hypothetical protein BRD17_00540, partial [Halobacteriales archaeon SW_7_68_16]
VVAVTSRIGAGPGDGTRPDRDPGDAESPSFTPSRRSATAATAIAALAGLTIGAAVGDAGPAAIGVVGALVVGRGIETALSAAPGERLGGAVAVVLGGSAAVVAAILAAVPPITGLAILAPLVADVDRGARFGPRVRALTRGIAFRSGVAVLAAALLAWALGSGAVAAVAVGLAGAVLAAGTAAPIVAVVILQFLVGLLYVGTRRAVRIVEGWVGPLGDDGPLDLAVASRRVRVVYALSLPVQVFGLDMVLATAGTPVESALAGSPAPAAIEALLVTVHAAVGLGFVPVVAVFSLRGGERIVRRVAGDDPGAAAAHAAGGAGIGLVAAVAALAGAGTAIATVAPAGLREPLVDLGFPWFVALVVVVATLTIHLSTRLVPTLASYLSGLVPDVAGGFGIAGAALFCATVGAAEAGAPALVTFLGVAGAILVVDFGGFAAGLGVELGDRPRTRRPESLHATASLVVGVVAVAAALGFLYGVVPTLADADRGSALAGLALALGAIVVLVLAAGRSGGPDGSSRP